MSSFVNFNEKKRMMLMCCGRYSRASWLVVCTERTAW